MAESTKIQETVRWRAYPSWAHFTWLYFFIVMTLLRAFLLLRLGLRGWEVWLGGAAMLFLCVAAMRRWGEYLLTSSRIVILNGFTGQEIQALAVKKISEVSIKQGPIGRIFNVGTLLIHSTDRDQDLSLKGVRFPEIIKTRIDALRA